jgi:hypothetical protein
MKDLESRAWAAGFWDGEGCATINLIHSRIPYAVITITQCGSPVLLKKFKKIVGVGKIYGPYPGNKSHNKKRYHLRTGGLTIVKKVFSILKPWLGAQKRKQFQEVIRIHKNYRKIL